MLQNSCKSEDQAYTWSQLHLFASDRVDILSSLFLNSSQLAEMKKYIPYMSLPLNLYGRRNWFKEIPIMIFM